MKQLKKIVLIAAALAACNSSGSSSNKVAPADLVAPPPSPSKADPREQLLAMAVGRMLETQHLRQQPVDDALSKKAFAEYLELLDPSKSFLLAEQVEALRKRGETEMDDQLESGNLTLAHAGADLMDQRVEVVRKLVEARLAKPFDFTVKENLETDPDKEAWAADEAALAERWRKTLKFEVMSRILRMEETAEALAKTPAEQRDAGVADLDIPDTFEAREKKAREELAKTYSARFARRVDHEPLDRAQTFLNAIATVYDPHTLYMPPISRDNFDIRMSGSLEGIGAVLSEDDHYIRVVSIVPGGASWRQGRLEAGDMIMAVQQEGEEPVDVGDMRINKVVQMIRGPKGTVVTLTVKKADETVEVISITRDIVEIESAYARGAVIEKNGAKVGYIYLPSFYGNTRSQPGQTPERDCTDDVRKLLGMLSKRGVDGVILDVRRNGGGLLSDAQEMTGLFIETGPVVQTRFPDGETEVLADRDPSVSFAGNLVVMVDRFSASASEILAGALQDYGRALIVGTAPTHGKGTVQVLVDLDRFASDSKNGPLGVLKITGQQFFRISGGSTQWKGVVPDVLLPDPDGYIESGERYLDNSIPWSEVAPVPYQRWTKSTFDPSDLQEKSKARTDGSELFAKVDKRTAILTRRLEKTTVPLAIDDYRAQRKRQREEVEKLDLDLSKGPSRFKVDVVDYDGKAKPKPSSKSGRKTGPSEIERWRDTLSRDPWVDEALLILADMG